MTKFQAFVGFWSSNRFQELVRNAGCSSSMWGTRLRVDRESHAPSDRGAATWLEPRSCQCTFRKSSTLIIYKLILKTEEFFYSLIFQFDCSLAFGAFSKLMVSACLCGIAKVSHSLRTLRGEVRRRLEKQAGLSPRRHVC